MLLPKRAVLVENCKGILCAVWLLLLHMRSHFSSRIPRQLLTMLPGHLQVALLLNSAADAPVLLFFSALLFLLALSFLLTLLFLALLTLLKLPALLMSHLLALPLASAMALLPSAQNVPVLQQRPDCLHRTVACNNLLVSSP